MKKPSSLNLLTVWAGNGSCCKGLTKNYRWISPEVGQLCVIVLNSGASLSPLDGLLINVNPRRDASTNNLFKDVLTKRLEGLSMSEQRVFLLNKNSISRGKQKPRGFALFCHRQQVSLFGFMCIVAPRLGR
jgi:hypothetical protein